eukprot:NODE_152_length_15391_cov_0.883272.p15 type:complete len:171 gc:universal NODE_152_length_15391_cov_0.883272:14499-13987(-)
MPRPMLDFELFPHATPHARIGGDMSGPSSPRDIVFWLHHAWVEKMHIEFHIKHPNAKYSDAYMDMTREMKYVGVSATDILDYSKLCYTYDKAVGGENTTVTDPGSLDDWFNKMNVTMDKRKGFESEFERIMQSSLLNNVVPSEADVFNDSKSGGNVIKMALFGIIWIHLQ